MSCLLMVKATSSIIDENGASHVIFSMASLLYKEEFDEIENLTKKGNRVNVSIKTNDKLQDMFDCHKIIKTSFLETLLSMNHDDAFRKIIEMENITSRGSTVAHHMAIRGFIFKINELMALNNPTNQQGETVAHIMAHMGYNFDVESIMKLGNPINNAGESIAHIMARKHHKFSVPELILLRDTKDINDQSITDLMAYKGNHLLSMEEWDELNKGLENNE